MIGIIGAMNVEVKGLISLLEKPTTESISNIDYHRGLLFGQEVVIAKCGVGKAYAAMCTQTMILKYQPKIIINTGVAGGLDSTLEINDLVIADTVVQHDFDLSALGDVIGTISGLGKANIPCSKKLITAFSNCADKLGYQYQIGRIASGDQFVSDVEKAKKIRSTFKAVACEMEGAVIGQIAYVNKVDFIVIRSISDIVDGKSHLKFPFTVNKAAKKSISLLEEFIKNYN